MRAGDAVLVTAVEDGLEHRVGAENWRAGTAVGRFHTLCGTVIGPVSLTVPAGPPCRVCDVQAGPDRDAAAGHAASSRHRRRRRPLGRREAGPEGTAECTARGAAAREAGAPAAGTRRGSQPDRNPPSSTVISRATRLRPAGAGG
ncbi:hypothetical protein GCM10009613_55690 [Pseudonocardia kongjuensis]|uniref:Uncharacterized protein n=1 Tax=Pseudonocardia kongjuensis TaxID=102227 RepID=A0ABP4IV86_9PSEU